MLNLPQTNPIIYKLQVKSFDPTQFMDSDDVKTIIRLNIDAHCYGLIVYKKSLEEVFCYSSGIRLLGNASLNALLKTALERTSIVTIDRLNESLSDFYSLLLSSSEEIARLSTNYISFWRFIETQKEKDNTGIAIINDSGNTLYSIFKSGMLVGGWQAFDNNSPSLELSPQKVMDMSARMNGEFFYYKSLAQIPIDVKHDFAFKMTNDFQTIYHPDHPNHRKILTKFGEAGIEIACQVALGLTLYEISQNTREPISRIEELVKMLSNLGLVEIK